MLSRSSSSGGQRRSSILKPPKSRQPFQDLDFNTSSPEISPESTKKRRVSFAEKKHVKEFCDHKEQGTIWDNTYEEPDQNVSKSIEFSNEHAEHNNVEIQYMENVEIVKKEAGFGILRVNPDQDSFNSQTFVIMDKNGVASTSKTIFFNPGTDLDFTDVIPSSCSTSNYLPSKTILCQDDDLEITEAIGKIEPTVSINKIVNPKPGEIRDSPSIEQAMKNLEKTTLFDDSGEGMIFTEIINCKRIQTPILPIITTLQDQDLENSNSLIENQTIIFEDSIMDLTLSNSQTESSLDPIKNVATIASETLGTHIELGEVDLGNNIDVMNCKSSQANNKTIIFHNFGCEMTEVVNSVRCQIPQANLDKENLPIESQNYSTASEEHNFSKGSNSRSTNSSTHGNKTILFNDMGCEMTVPINTLRAIPAEVDKVIETNETELIVPQQLLPMNSITEMEIQPSSSQSSPKLISKSSDRTEFFDDYSMELTTAITKEKNMEIELKEHFILERDKTVIFDNCNIDITEAVKTTLFNLNSGLSTKEQENLVSPQPERNDLHGKNKRKSIETERLIDCNELSNTLTMNSKSAEYDLVQRSICDQSMIVTMNNSSNTLSTNCKRLKVTEKVLAEESKPCLRNDSVSLQTEQLGNIMGETITLHPPSIQRIPEKQIETSTNVENAIKTTNSSVQQDAESITSSSNCCIDQEKSLFDDHTKVEVKITNDEVNEEESFFARAGFALRNSDSDSESEISELLRSYVKQERSLVEKSRDAESCLDSNKCLNYNDDCCFLMFSEELERHSKSENCIWAIRSLDTKKILIDFISKSLVVVIHLEDPTELTAPSIIKDIQIISLLPDSADEDISMIHNILLKTLDPENLKLVHRTTLNVLPMLELISQKIKLLLDFMYEFDKLQDLHIINRLGNRISFRLHSYKVQLVIKITIDLERFEDIEPNDVEVECILGNIREKDIRQIITSVKKDHRFLSNYINDIKEYIALVVEK